MNRDSLLLKVASLYYEKGHTQEQIAKQVRRSRSTVVRMLKRAIDEGVVEIRLIKRPPHTIELETAIEEAFAAYGLQQVIVVDSEDADPKETVAGAAAEYLATTLRSSHVLGVGWSSTLMHIAKYLRASRYRPKQIVQLGGFVGGIGSANSQEIALHLGQILRAPVATIPAPVLVATPDLCQELRRDPYVAATMEWVLNCNIGIVGIGEATEKSTLVQAGYLTEEEIDLVRSDGAVGDVLSHYFDSEGREIETPWFDRMISIDLATLRKVDNLIGVAAGTRKAQAVIGAIRCRVFNTLIIDTPLAEALT